MRKLLLASLDYNFGDNHYVMTRLVVVTDDDRKSGLEDSQIATRKAEQWFRKNVAYRSIESIVAYDAIDEPLDFATEHDELDLKMEPKPIVLDASWNNCDVFPPIAMSVFKGKPYPESYTDTVLIDIDGKRKDFATGWYDMDDKVWRFDEDAVQFDPNMKWQLLPLAKYDK